MPTPTHTTETTYGAWFDSGDRAGAAGRRHEAPRRPQARGGRLRSRRTPTSRSIYQLDRQTESRGRRRRPSTDPELRTRPTAYTPLGRSLFYARLYFDNFINTAADPQPRLPPEHRHPRHRRRRDVRQRLGHATLNLPTCAHDRATRRSTPSCRPASCCAALQGEDLRPHGHDRHDDRERRNHRDRGRHGRRHLRHADRHGGRQGGAASASSPRPCRPSEICNGKDDNCNGQIDEGVQQHVPASRTTRTTPTTCTARRAKHCAVETCNCKDDNCNGHVDEGLPTNACGGPAAAPYRAEMCDGLDNNCDGNIDEGFIVGAACTNSGVGACRRGGILACNAARHGHVLRRARRDAAAPRSATTSTTTATARSTTACCPAWARRAAAALGNCMAGVTACVNGKLVCNADQHADDRDVQRPRRRLQRHRRRRHLPRHGRRPACAPASTPAQVERRRLQGGPDGVPRRARHRVRRLRAAPRRDLRRTDNDCDGMADMNADVPVGLRLPRGPLHARRARGGEFPCPSGYKCVDDYCMPQRCAGKTCPPVGAATREPACASTCARASCAPPASDVPCTGRASTATRWAARPGQICNPAGARPTSAWA